MAAFHALSGSDITGKYSGISKETAFKRFLDAPETITEKLKVLGEPEQTIESLYENVVPFLCYLYQTPYSTIEDARWFLYSKGAVPEEMPPSREVFKQHILRAHYVTMIWKNALNPHFSPPDPCDYGWRTDSHSNLYMPVFSTHPICPPKLQDMVTCKNCKSGCATKRCSCLKLGIPCTEMCGCHMTAEISCQNLSDLYKQQISDDESDGSDED